MWSLDGLADGRREDWRDFVAQWTPRIAGYARQRMFGMRSSVDDVVQDTFLEVHLKLKNFDRTRQFGSWVMAIASRRCVDAYRARSLVAQEIQEYDSVSSGDILSQLADDEEMEICRSLVAEAARDENPDREFVSLAMLCDGMRESEAAALAGVHPAQACRWRQAVVKKARGAYRRKYEYAQE